MRALYLAGLLLLVWIAVSVHELMGIDAVGVVIFATGLILLTAYFGGGVAEMISLPRITGYLLIGFVIGPSLLGLLSEQMIENLRPINGIAVSLIAMTAGMEISVQQLKRLWRRMLVLTTCNILGVFLLVYAALLVVSPWVPFLSGEPLSFILVVCLVFGSIAVATSPTVTIALITEYRAKGPLSETVLSVTVLKDIVVILFFATSMAVAKPLLDADTTFDPSFMLTIGGEIFGSLAAGAVLGWLVSLIVSRVRREAPLFVVGLAVLIAQGSGALHLEPLLVALVAGFFLESLSPRDATPLLHGIEESSFPVYAIFFALAGATIHLDALADLWAIALFLVVVRAGALFVGTWAGAKWTDSPEPVRRYGWMGFISQAGVTLGLSVIVVRAFPDWGPGIQTIVVAMIAVHELLGPIAFRYALGKANEIGREEGEVKAAPSH